MRSFLFWIFIFVLILDMGSCVHSQREDAPQEKELTSFQRNSIRHQEINDSITSLDTIRLLGSLYMGMTPEEYSLNKEKVTLPIKIAQLQFNELDTSLYHNVLHGVYIKAYFHDYAYDMDDMASKIKYGEEAFREVVKTLSMKYGKGSVYEISKLTNNGHQYGNAIWIFDNLTVEYEHHQNVDLRGSKFYINAKIKYYIPRIPTEEEKQIIDSISKDYDRRVEAVRQKNEEAKSNL